MTSSAITNKSHYLIETGLLTAQLLTFPTGFDIASLSDSVFPEAPEDKEEDVSLELFSSSECFLDSSSFY